MDPVSEAMSMAKLKVHMEQLRIENESFRDIMRDQRKKIVEQQKVMIQLQKTIVDLKEKESKGANLNPAHRFSEKMAPVSLNAHRAQSVQRIGMTQQQTVPSPFSGRYNMLDSLMAMGFNEAECRATIVSLGAGVDINSVIYKLTSTGSVPQGSQPVSQGGPVPPGGQHVPQGVQNIPQDTQHVVQGGQHMPQSSQRVYQAGQQVSQSGQPISQSGQHTPVTQSAVSLSQHVPIQVMQQGLRVNANDSHQLQQKQGLDPTAEQFSPVTAAMQHSQSTAAIARPSTGAQHEYRDMPKSVQMPRRRASGPKDDANFQVTQQRLAAQQNRPPVSQQVVSESLQQTSLIQQFNQRAASNSQTGSRQQALVSSAAYANQAQVTGQQMLQAQQIMLQRAEREKQGGAATENHSGERLRTASKSPNATKTTRITEFTISTGPGATEKETGIICVTEEI
eukprot:618769_1